MFLEGWALPSRRVQNGHALFRKSLTLHPFSSEIETSP